MVILINNFLVTLEVNILSLPDNSERSVANGPVRLDIQLLLLLLEVVCVLLLLVMVMMVVVRFDGGGSLNLGGCRGRRRPGSLPRRGRGEVGLLLAGVEHHGGGGGRGRGGVLLHRVHGGGGARVLQVMLARVVMVVHVGRREVLELVVVMRVMRGHS